MTEPPWVGVPAVVPPEPLLLPLLLQAATASVKMRAAAIAAVGRMMRMGGGLFVVPMSWIISG